MSIIAGFTRQEVIALTKTTSNRLQYLERTGLIIPHRVGSTKKPTVIYTWEQMLEVLAIKSLREEVSLQTVRKIVDFLNKSGFDDKLRDKQLVVIDDEVFWVKQDWSDFSQQMPVALKVASKRDKEVGQYTLLVIPAMNKILEEIWGTAKESDIIDFKSFKERAKARPREALAALA